MIGNGRGIGVGYRKTLKGFKMHPKLIRRSDKAERLIMSASRGNSSTLMSYYDGEASELFSFDAF